MTEQEAIEWFKKCVFYRNEREPFKMAIQALEQTQWIPCSERLPEEKQDVLACFYNGNGDYKLMVSCRIDYNYWNGVGRTGDMVAWMPLPKPYEPRERANEKL